MGSTRCFTIWDGDEGVISGDDGRRDITFCLHGREVDLVGEKTMFGWLLLLLLFLILLFLPML